MGVQDKVRKADALLRKVLLKDREYSNVKCVTCHRVAKGKELTVGHFLGRTRLNVRFDPQNVSLQCVECNFNHQGRPVEFEAALRKKWGDQAIDELKIRANQRFDQDIDQIIEELKKRLKNGD